MHQDTTRVVLFTSGLRGYWMLRFLTRPEVSAYYRLQVVGVVTDDPQLGFSNARRRAVWNTFYDPEFEPLLVPALCNRFELPYSTTRVRDNDFQETYFSKWKPDIALVNVFGQKIPHEIYSYPRLGTFNFHTTSGSIWPRFGGPDPLRQINKAGLRTCRVACHHVSEEFDDGQLYKFTEEIPIPLGASVDDMQLMLASVIVCFLKDQLPGLLGLHRTESRFEARNSLAIEAPSTTYTGSRRNASGRQLSISK